MSLAQEIRDLLAAHPQGLTVPEMAPLCAKAETNTQIALAVFSLQKAGRLLRDGQRGAYRYRLAPEGTTVRAHVMDEDEENGDSSTGRDLPEESSGPDNAAKSAAVRAERSPAPAPPQLNPSEAPAQGTSPREPEGTGTRKRGAPPARRPSAGSLPVPVQSALPVDSTRDATNAVDRDLQLAITDAGVLALRRGDACLFLDPAEVQRMTAFLQRVGVAA